MSIQPILERILREAGIPELFDLLATRLEPTDLQSLLLAVYRERAQTVAPRTVLERYERDRFVNPALVSAAQETALDQLIWSLLPEGFEALALSPLCPLGTEAAVVPVDQNNVVTTIRNTEVLADITNVLALECAVRRRLLLEEPGQKHKHVCLSALHRVVRAQAYSQPAAHAHFRLLGICTAGRDEGSSRFEMASLTEHIDFYLHLLQNMAQLNLFVGQVRLAVTALTPRAEEVMTSQVLPAIQAAHPHVSCDFEPDRATEGRYYTYASFHIYAANHAGEEYQLVDGGCTSWTQQWLSNGKERLLISGLGLDRLWSEFSAS